jgi:hypothetical protein
MYLPNNTDQQFERFWIVHERICVDSAVEVGGRLGAILGAKIWTYVVTVGDSALDEGIGAGAMGEADAKTRMTQQHAAHEECADGEGGLGWHACNAHHERLGRNALVFLPTNHGSQYLSVRPSHDGMSHG